MVLSGRLFKADVFGAPDAILRSGPSEMLAMRSAICPRAVLVAKR